MRKTIEQSAPATFFQRLCAFLLDTLLIGAVLGPFRLIGAFIPVLHQAVIFRFTYIDLIAWILATAYLS